MTRRVWPLAVFVAHGVLDTTVTLAVFLAHRTTEIESNPFIKAMLREAITNPDALGWRFALYLAPVVGVKAGVAGVAAVALWMLRPRGEFVPVRRWRAWCAALAAFGVVVVLNNLAAVSNLRI